jgi:hypothetical protein
MICLGSENVLKILLNTMHMQSIEDMHCRCIFTIKYSGGHHEECIFQRHVYTEDTHNEVRL